MTNFFSWLPARWLVALLVLVAATGPALAQPTVTVTTSTPVESLVTEDQAPIGGTVVVSGGATVTEVGVEYRVDNSLNPGSYTPLSMSLNGTSFAGYLTVGVTKYAAGTLYNIRAYAKSGGTTAYGSVVSFYSRPKAPEVYVSSTGVGGLLTGALLNTRTPSYSVRQSQGSVSTFTVTGGGITQVISASTTSQYTVQPTPLPADGIYTVYGTVTLGLFGTAAFPISSNPALSTTNTFTIDATPPTATISSSAGTAGSTTTIATRIPFTVTFTEPVTGFSTTNLSGSSVTVTNGSVDTGSFQSTGTTSVSNGLTFASSYVFTVTPTTAGATTVGFAANVARDLATNGNTAASPFALIYAPPTAPTVTTDAPVPITRTSAVLGGVVTSDGGAAGGVTARGSVYSATNALPTVLNSTIVSAGPAGTGSYSSAVSGLTPGTLYYVRAYATNSIGTSYGSVQTFTIVANAPGLAFATPTVYSKVGPGFNSSAYNLGRLVVRPASSSGFNDRIFYTDPQGYYPSPYPITGLAYVPTSGTPALNSYNTGGTNPIGIGFGDVNGDGYSDMVAANMQSDNASVTLGNQMGVITTGNPYSTGTGSAPQGVAVGDLDGDLRRDIVTANTGNNTVGVLLSTTRTSPSLFGPVATYNTTSSSAPKDVALGDLDGDGRLDIVTGGGTVGVLLSTTRTSPGLFGPVVTYGAGTDWVAVGDADNNGSLDIITGAGVLLNTGTGTFGTLLTSGGGGAAVADLNLDGKLDIVVANSYSGVGVKLGTGSGLFGPITNYSVSSSLSNVTVNKVAVGDVNNDGRPDIALTGFDGFFNTIAVLLNTSAPLSPTLMSLSATSGQVGTSITLTGVNISGVTKVSFNGVAATTFAAVNSTTVTATVPVGATSGNVTLTTGTVSNGLPFTVTYPNIVVSTAGQTIAGGTYNSIAVSGSGVATLSGDVTVNTSLTVQSGATLNDGCATIGGAGSFTLAAGGTLGICNGAGIASSGATGAVQVTGTRSFSPDASYRYNGSTAQTTGTGLPSQVRNLTTTNPTALTLSAGTSVSQVLTIGAAGSLVTGGKALTLLSNAAGTAMVVNSSTGVVSGSATYQRYIDPSVNLGPGYRHFSAPIGNATVNSLTTSSFTPVVNAAYNTSAQPSTVTPFPTVFGYDQARLATASNNLSGFDKGWFSPSALSDILTVGRGYTVNLAASQTVSFTGSQNNAAVGQSALTLTLPRNAAGTPNASDGGFHLVGNPFPSPVDYNQVAAADRPNLDPTIYVFTSGAANPYTGSYRSVLNGVGGSATLPMAQGFFVHVADGTLSATLNFRNSQRVTSYTNPAYLRPAETRPLVQLTLQGAGSPNQDDAYVYFEPGATDGYEPAFDALKLPNSTGLNLSASISGKQLAIDGYGVLGSTQRVVPLAVGVPAPGSYTFTATQLLNLGSVPVYLRDLLSGALIDLAQQPSYPFTVNNASALLTGRFELVFSPNQALATVPAALAQQVAVYPNPATNAVFLELPASLGRQAVTTTLLDALGRQVRTLTLPAQGTVAHQLDLHGLATGVYALRLSTNAGTLVKRLTVE